MRLSPWWAAAAFSAAAVADEAAPIKRWDKGPAPPLALARLDGGTVNLAALRGRVVVLNFWATWCEPCREEMPSLDRLRAKMAGKPVEVLAVNFGEGRERAEAFVARQRISTPVLLDPDKKAAGDWKVGGLPMTFLIDAGGRVRFWTFGERDWSQGEGLRRIEALVREAPRAGS